MIENPWYSELREAWKPSHVRLLLIAESAPDDGGSPENRRFFYSDRLGHDNLFRGVVAAMYGATRDDLAKQGKRPWLERLREDGFYLIDLVPHPVNASQAHLRARRAEYVDDCVRRASELNPDGVIVVKKDLYPLLRDPIPAAGLDLLNNTGIAFPLGNTRREFITGFTTAHKRLRPSAGRFRQLHLTEILGHELV